MILYKSTLFRYISTIVNSPLLLLGLKTEQQTIKIKLINNYEQVDLN